MKVRFWEGRPGKEGFLRMKVGFWEGRPENGGVFRTKVGFGKGCPGKDGFLRTRWGVKGGFYGADDDEQEGMPTVAGGIGFDNVGKEVGEHVEEEGFPFEVQYKYCGKEDTSDYEGGTTPAADCVTYKDDEGEGEDGKDYEQKGYYYKYRKRSAESGCQSVGQILLEIVCPQTQIGFQDRGQTFQ